MHTSSPTLYLVVMGTDPELLPVRVYNLLAKADWVVFDACVAAGKVQTAAGKSVYLRGSDKREDRGRVLQCFTTAGPSSPRVVWLKGSAVEEWDHHDDDQEFFRRAGVAVEVVPTIPAAFQALSSAQIPITCRGINEGFCVITIRETQHALEPVFFLAVRSTATIIVVGGTRFIREIALVVKQNRSPSEPVLIVGGPEAGGVMRFSTAAAIAAQRDAYPVGSLDTLVIGRVVVNRSAAGLKTSIARSHS